MDASFVENSRIDEKPANAWANVREGAYTFPVRGTICHHVGTFLTVGSRTPRSVRLYIFDMDMEAK
jgi:hypothetical protein